jgi:hypothetical protein
MHDNLARILQKTRQLQSELEQELSQRRVGFASSVEEGKVRFEEAVLAQHRRLRKGLRRFLLDSSLLTYLTAPVVYSLILPIALLDSFISGYQRICFPIYGIPRVRRRDYVLDDRHRLAYLNLIERLNCLYCGYANGVIAYAREVASRTEQYWCPIKHARRVRTPHDRYYRFLEYGDAQGYAARLEDLRRTVRETLPAPAPPQPPT